jgi:prefoldin subunit 4
VVSGQPNASAVIILSIIPYVINWCFLLLQKMLDKAKSRVQSEIEDLELKCAELRSIMSDMKTQLYAKFGNHINLEAEDD